MNSFPLPTQTTCQNTLLPAFTHLPKLPSPSSLFPEELFKDNLLPLEDFVAPQQIEDLKHWEHQVCQPINKCTNRTKQSLIFNKTSKFPCFLLTIPA